MEQCHSIASSLHHWRPFIHEMRCYCQQNASECHRRFVMFYFSAKTKEEVLPFVALFCPPSPQEVKCLSRHSLKWRLRHFSPDGRLGHSLNARIDIFVVYKYKLTLKALCYIIFIHLKLCLATAIHNFKWVKIHHICII